MAERTRLGLNELEKIAAVPFILFAGLVGGGLQSLGEFARNGTGALVAFFIVIGAAVVLWWASVRRRRYSVWRAAFHLTVAMALSQVISFALVVPRTAHAEGVQIDWLNAIEQVLWVQLALSPIRFIGAALLVALGRLLPGSGRGEVGRRAAASAEGS
jgi:hypothetical protein